MSLDYPILPICQTAESFGNILSAMGPYQDSLSRKSTLFGPNTRPEIPIRFGYCAIPCIGGLCEERLPCSNFALVLKCSLKDNQMSLWSMMIHIYPCLAFRKLHSVLPSEMYLRDKYSYFISFYQKQIPRPLDVTTLWH